MRNRWGHPTLETKLGNEPGAQLRELLGDCTAVELIECVAFGGLDGFVSACGGKTRFVDEGGDVAMALYALRVPLGPMLKRIGRGKVQRLVDDVLTDLAES